MQLPKSSGPFIRSTFQNHEDNYNEYLMAMKRVRRQSLGKESVPPEMMTPRERHRIRESKRQALTEGADGGLGTPQQATRVSIFASMVPDEIIYKCSDHSIRSYEAALMFIDVSGFTDLCEAYTKAGRGGPSRLTQVLNTYIGAMVQEILSHDGDVLNFSGDAFLSMWKKSSKLTIEDAVHSAIDCGLLIQKNCGTYLTDVGVVLKVKVAIAAGLSHFSIIGDGNINQAHYVIVGQPVWDVKMAEYVSTAGDVLTSSSVWMYVNEAEYSTQPCRDGKHTKILGVGVSWQRVEKLDVAININRDNESTTTNKSREIEFNPEVNFREYSLRPAMVSAIRSNWWICLRRFMVTPVLRAVDNDEPMDCLAEVRRVVVVFINIVTKAVTENTLINIVDSSYKCVCRVMSDSGGLVNKVSMFDKDMMFLVVFGLRGLKHEDEAQKALECAYELKEKLANSDTKAVSIGITSGTTYCGVVGHVLRREYTVIGSAVNKAARLMVVYTNKVTCDKETFLRSKLDQDFFKLMEYQPLKGIAKPGPVYEFNKLGWPERVESGRHPLLGRNEELRKYQMTLQNALKQQHQNFTRYRDHVFGFAVIGGNSVGKTRLLEECIYITPNYVRVAKIVVTQTEKMPFGVIRQIMVKILAGSILHLARDKCENRIRASVDLSSMNPTQIHAVNTIFNCRFPLPEKFTYTGDLLADMATKNLIRTICRYNIKSLWIVVIEEANSADDDSWRVLLLLMEAKVVFIILTISDEHSMTAVASDCLSNNMFLKLHLMGINRRYHAALACQLLDVQAIPPDLEKVIQSASGGMPGWIQNFVISLVQRGALSVVTVTCSDALKAGAVMPSPALLQRENNVNNEYSSPIYSLDANASILNTDSIAKQKSPKKLHKTMAHVSELIQMAVLTEPYNFVDMNVDMTMDAIILKTYDSLTPFEKMLLKCSSVLGDVFSRRMLLHLLQSDSPRKVAQAVAKLFSIRVLECEGGDFTKDTSLVLVHPAPALPAAKPPYCACLGIRMLPDCRDLPMYAFCGYMKFKHSLFRTTTYELLTESQKHEMHFRALLYLERYTRRCSACGSGCFIKLLGQRCDDGLIDESPEMKSTRLQIQALAAETRVSGEYGHNLPFAVDPRPEQSFYVPLRGSPSTETLEKGELRRLRESALAHRKHKRVRSFSSLEMKSCECLPILMSVYCQIIDHCRGAEEYEKLYEAYLEYADLSLMNLNYPQAIRLLFEVEAIAVSDKLNSKKLGKIQWLRDYRLGRILSLRGACMLESGDFNEAKKQLLHALQLYSDPFPSSKFWVKLRNMKVSIQQILAIYIVPQFYVAHEKGFVGEFYEEIAETLNRLYRLYSECKESNNAALAARWAFNYALKTNANFRLLCESYGNLITVYRNIQKFSVCLKLEEKAMGLCHRKRGQLDATEVRAVCSLYTSIFSFYVEYGKKKESLEFGLSVMPMITNLTDMTTRQMLILWMLKLLLCDLRIHDAVSVMREFFYNTDHYDLSSATWYYFYSMVILLDTGYSVESYQTCERFYIKKGDAILRSKTPEAAWNFFACMWLVTVRIGAWERSILWEEKIKLIVSMKFRKHEYTVLILSRLVEGLLILLVREIDNRNSKKIVLLNKTIKSMFQDMKNACQHTPMYKPRYNLLFAYFNYMRGKKFVAFRYLNKTIQATKPYAHGIMSIWAEHTQKHWRGTLSPTLEGFWMEHVEPGNLLDYRDFDVENGKKIIPFTLPLPKHLISSTL